MKAAQKLALKLESATKLNNDLASQVDGGASGLTATFFVNANKGLVKVQKEIRNALNNGKISINEYRSLVA